MAMSYAWCTPMRLADGLGRPSRPSCKRKIHPKNWFPHSINVFGDFWKIIAQDTMKVNENH
jgi:hypothetical protein